MKMTGAEIIVALLERQEVSLVAGIPGGPLLPFYDALSQSRKIRHVLARHEQGAGFIAQGFARASGKVGVCIASSGPGVTNLITAIADAHLDSIPLVAITGQVPLAMIGTDAFQEVDTVGISRPITKHNFLVKSAAQLLDVVPRAFAIARSGRPGPVLIDVPKDVQNEVLEFDAWPEADAVSITDSKVPPLDNAALRRAAEMINRAERPVLYLGGGIIHSGAAALATELAEKASLPTTTTLMALGAIAADHPLNLGMLGMHAARFTNMALHECDLLIAVGARFDDRATGKVAGFCPEAKIIHIDIDAAELNKIKAARVGIVGDAAKMLEALLPQVETKLREPWLSRVAELKHNFPLVREGLDDPRSHYGLIHTISGILESIAPGAIVTTDVGQHQMWVAQALPMRLPRQWITSGGLGTMGFGLPAAIGAALARPDRPVICFSGDGSILMNLQEFATAVEENVNIKIVLMNNRALGLVQQQQTMFYGRRLFASQYGAGPDFVKIAQGFGMAAVDLDKASNPRLALADAILTPGPFLIHASIDNQARVLPMVPPGAGNLDMIVG